VPTLRTPTTGPSCSSSGVNRRDGYRIEGHSNDRGLELKKPREPATHAKEYVAIVRLEDRHDDGEWIVTTRHGEKRVCKFSSTPVGRDPTDAAVVGNAIHITDRQRANPKLAAANNSSAHAKLDRTRLVMMDGRGYVRPTASNFSE